MKYLIYMSTSVQLFGDSDLKQLLRESQAYNLLNGITGLMLYSNGSFVQVLEGDDDEVDLLYRKIQQDKRHKNVLKIIEGDIKDRVFPNWAMGFTLVSSDQISMFDAYVDPKHYELLNNHEPHPAITILKTFADINSF